MHTHPHTHTSVVTLLCIPLFWWIKFSSINKQNNFKVITLQLLIKIASVIRLRIRLKADKVLCYAISKILFSLKLTFLGACSFFPQRYRVLQRKTFCMGIRKYVFSDYTVFAQSAFHLSIVKSNTKKSNSAQKVNQTKLLKLSKEVN